jgi:hypothetical protein
MTAVLVCLSVAVFHTTFYRSVVRRWGRPANAVVRRTAVLTRHPRRDVDATAKLVAAALAQSAFALLLVAAARLGPPAMFEPIRVELLLMGCLLGLAELSLATLVCGVVVETALLLAPERRRGEVARAWLMEGRGGWMGQFAATQRVASRTFATFVISLYVAGEEVVFRGVLIHVLRPAGSLAAVGIAAILFVVAQVRYLPSARAAVFPAVGAAVIGSVHGMLFWRVPDLLPLVAAHLTFLLGALTPRRQANPISRMS